jgi:hypothetical protein
MDGPQPGPWSSDVAREVGAKRRPQVGARPFGYFWGNAKSNSRVRRETKTPSTRANEEKQGSRDTELTLAEHYPPQPLKQSHDSTAATKSHP